MFESVIKKLDEVDMMIRGELQREGIRLPEIIALEKARELVQQAISPLVRQQ